MATSGRTRLIGILIFVGILAIGFFGLAAGWWGVGIGDGVVCNDPDGCACGITTTCTRGETCDRTIGLFGQCRPQ